MKNERWIITQAWSLIRQDNVGPDPKTGEPCTFPYLAGTKHFLEGYHTSTMKRLHTYGPFDDLESLEAFAREHHIDLQAK